MQYGWQGSNAVWVAIKGVMQYGWQGSNAVRVEGW